MLRRVRTLSILIVTAAHRPREALALASLNHSGIAAIHGFEESGSTAAIVMELVEGETLAERLKRGPLPMEDALPIARQVCDAAGAAHAKGIAHRDLKATNIKITPEGKVKLLDFGLAKALEKAPLNPQASNSPTLIGESPPGVILGTAAYMSPEQARGQQSDAQSDIWAFGCILHEMLAGKQAFTGETITDVRSPEPTPRNRRIVTARRDAFAEVCL